MALIVIPTVAAVLLGGLRITENVQDTLTHERIETTATLGEAIVELANQLGHERLLTAAYIAESPNPNNRSQQRRLELEEQQQVVDQAVNEVRTGALELGEPGTDLAGNRLSSMLTSLDDLGAIRSEVADTRVTVLPAVTKYRQLIDTLVGFNETIAEDTGDTALRESVRALTALSKARDQLSYEAALMLHSLMRNSMSGGIQEAIESTRARYDNEIQNFTSSATIDQRRIYDDTFSGLEVNRMSTMRLRVMMRVDTQQSLTGLTAGDTAGDYFDVANESLDRMREVETALSGEVRGQAAGLKAEARNDALVDSGFILLLLAAVLVMTLLVVRSMVGPLRALREGALRVAETELPRAITRMRESSAGPGEVKVAPVGVDSADEIGEVARSFDEVHRVAVRLASDEAALRSNVNAMFVNLSRRSQTLVERQLRLIDGLEQSEQDSDRLGDLFQLDHLATRMRRNNENLLVLSGQDNTRKWAQPVPLVDVLRGAISEVEQYERVNVRAPSHISVLGRPVNDVIHLVAELVENATSFSAHDTQVSVTARALESGEVMIEVTDSGIGMPPEEIEATNERLAKPPVIDVAVSRRMGLFVVGRLAARHGIQVRLRPAHNGGVTALVALPADLLISPVDASAPPALGTGRGGVPDTYAEATAAFAASPAPSDPSDVWQSPKPAERPSWQRETPSGLPKRNGQGRSDEPEPPEHPPSGQDLWGDTGWLRPADPPEQSTPPAAPRPAESRPEPPVQEPQRRWERSGESASEHTGSHVWERPDRGAQTGSWQRPAPAAPNAAASPAATGGEEAHGATAGTGSGADNREGYGSTAYLSKRYGAPSHRTVVPPSPESNSEPLPIFDSIESNWFRRRSGRPAVTAPDVTGPLDAVEDPRRPAADGGQRPSARPANLDAAKWSSAPNGTGARPQRPAPAAEPAPEPTWESESDRGWEAARSAAEPLAGGLTSAGLPKRVPKANLVPGTAPAPENFKQIPARSADQVRNRFSSFQQGIRQGRSDAGERQPKEK
ncbi:nitrate- and nitrite sensing domain-containing protein [Marinactinospora rubrisoli]|uniref:histidine kinase n=1 Tax=Marinactinospora rubrisoli TaxID=2715399 RepID=A0ABW2KN58_9ACTN